MFNSLHIKCSLITQTIDVFAGIEDILLWRLHVAHVSAIVFVAYQLLVFYPQVIHRRDTAEIQLSSG